jgi:hypothetical protein
MKWLKLFLGIFFLAFAFAATWVVANARDPGPGVPDTEYTRMLAQAVQQGETRLPRVPGKYVHLRIQRVFPLAKVFTFGYMDIWLGPDPSESQQIEQDSQGTATVGVAVQDKTVTTYNYRSKWSDQRVLDSAEIAAQFIEGNLWGTHQALLAKKAIMVSESANTISVRVTRNDSPSTTLETTLDRKTHLPLLIQEGMWPVRYEYLAIEITTNGPANLPEPPPVKSTIMKMTLDQARRFTQFPLYYLGEEFLGYYLEGSQYTYQDLADKDINQVGFYYLPKGQTKGDAPVYLVVEPKSQVVLDDLAKKAKAGLTAADGQIGKVPTGHVLMLTIRDDAVIRLYGPDEATVRAMRESLRPLRAVPTTPTRPPYP